MNTDKFNPLEWLDTQHTDTKTHTVQPASTEWHHYPRTIEADIETVTARIEAAATDITAGYAPWRDLGFALADALGESGRPYYHRLSRLNPDYTQAETDRQYDRCLSAKGHGITIRTFFQLAKDHGISVSVPRPKSTISTISTESTPADIVDSVDSVDFTDQEPMPAFTPLIRSDLPAFLQKITAAANSDPDADILLLGSLTVLSACLPSVSGIYADREVYPNLFLFVTASASSGKGRLALCRHLAEPIHDRLREICEAETMDYRHRLAEYNAAGKRKVDLEKPQEPPMRMLFIPANSSATAVYQVLNDNGGQGLMFETEGDTLANTFGSDYGNYSDGFRKAFHHETISYIRRKDREYVNIRTPRLSALLTGTPRQVHSLIPDAENGLFSRFIFYRLTTRPVWLDVFDSTIGQTHDRYFHTLGAEYHDYHRILSGSTPLTFTLTTAQQTAFNDTFRQYQDTWRHHCGDGFIATVRRMGLITFRTAMILSALRIMDTGDIPPVLTCTEADFTTALTIAGILLQHSAAVYRELPGCSGTAPSDKPTPTLLHRTILESLPQEFDRATAARLADNLGINPKSVDRLIKRWCGEGTLIKVSHGNYRKNQ